ncbi:MAG: alpha/beta fold hydrolase, partial [Limisphaerales bacterium]
MGFETSPDDELLDALLEPYSTETGKLSLIRNASALNTNLTTEITHLLPKIDVPVRILWGENDKFQLGEIWRMAGARYSGGGVGGHFR